MDPDPLFDIPSVQREALLEALGLARWQEWSEPWRRRKIEEAHQHLWAQGTSPDWLWSLALPLLSVVQDVEPGKRCLIGLSALPGCGKTTLGRWMETAAQADHLSLQVMSIDDFYLPSPALDQAMAGNPWSVPRALPGSHDIELMHSTLSRWASGESVEIPQFNKALRQGRGDRSGWRECNADVLLLEGWFVGCEPLADPSHGLSDGSAHLAPPLTDEEKQYRSIVQTKLADYQTIWQKMHLLWQIAAPDLNAPLEWKEQQNQTQIIELGAGLPPDELQGFIRMIAAAIPFTCFEQMPADVTFSTDLGRRLTSIRVNPELRTQLPQFP